LGKSTRIRELFLLQRDFILLELRDGLIELRFLLYDLQRQVRVAQLDQGLSFLDHVAGLDEHSIHSSSIDSVDVDRFAGHHRRMQRDEIVEHTTLDSPDSYLLYRQAERSHCATSEEP
jgi:hypothetical protein